MNYSCVKGVLYEFLLDICMECTVSFVYVTSTMKTKLKCVVLFVLSSQRL